jgi:hypothetical protein
MNDDSVPTREAWGDIASDLDVEYGFRMFGGKTIEEATPVFAENPIERASELSFTPAAVFNYYVFAFAAAALAPASKGESDLASCFLRLVRTRAVEQPAGLAKVWTRLHGAVASVSERQAFYDADADTYGSFTDLRHEAEAAMRQYEEHGA